MGTCQVSVYLAYAMAIYCLACVYYLVQTRNVGTPFSDSLTKKQIRIKEESSKVRKVIFYQGICVSAIFLILLRPFALLDN
jgi:uncharacterized membrane protein YjgN (DUF898 family)